MNSGCSGTFKEEGQTPPDLIALAAICSEAAQLHGGHWAAIERHITEAIQDLPPEQRQRLAKELDRVLRYRAPDWNAQTQ